MIVEADCSRVLIDMLKDKANTGVARSRHSAISIPGESITVVKSPVIVLLVTLLVPLAAAASAAGVAGAIAMRYVS